MSENDARVDGRPWVRGPLSARIVAAVLPVIALGGLLGALFSTEGLGDFPRAAVWALVAALFGVTTGWLLGVLLVPTADDLAASAGDRSPAADPDEEDEVGDDD